MITLKALKTFIVQQKILFHINLFQKKVKMSKILKDLKANMETQKIVITHSKFLIILHRSLANMNHHTHKAHKRALLLVLMEKKILIPNLTTSNQRLMKQTFRQITNLQIRTQMRQQYRENI